MDNGYYVNNGISKENQKEGVVRCRNAALSFSRTKNMDVDEEEDNMSSSIIFQEGSKLTVEQIELDRDDYVKQIRELARDNNVFIMYNVWRTFLGFYERANKDLADLGNYNDYWRIRPFKEYYERNRDKPCFEEAIYFRTIHNEQSLIRMTR